MLKKKTLLTGVLGILSVGYGLFKYVHQRDSKSLKSTPPKFAADNQAMLWAQEFKQLPKQRVMLTSFDNLQLVASLTCNSKNKGTVILVHGFGVDHYSLDKIGAVFYKLGFNVLQPDNRAAGMSAGRYMSYGHLEKYDVQNWLWHVLTSKQLNHNLILFGASMGAATVLQSLSLQLPTTLKGVVADSSYTNAKDIMDYNIHRQTGLSAKPITPLLSLWSRLIVGSFYSNISASKAVLNNKIPLLFVRGLKDTTVPPEMSEQLYNVAGGKAKLVSFADAAHIRAIEAQPRRYYQMIADFCQQVFA
ncbi:alpha/beta hydrolase [Bombilactobacillus thymidiniphilus]|uniref:Alpha/beta hydrolase n=1 Tax=Bombilactobacillus thymidiniphilus TaxID=2923363 RepID=A0ABY4PF39_9LACO|nr:alpha/beta hydrolase [Bombilactobacillus thymidiniphilus]UQS84212.1 alpha/beta hydrolase [Bombilactobacillus thymidiniphilus]